jgi:hypothetical protein
LVDCNAVLRQVTGNLQSLIDENQAVVERERLPFIYGNDILLVQLFQNLVANAIKYRSASSPLVRISGGATDSAWVFSVQDNGVGIDPKYHEYIFGVFRRLDRGGGAGMGLAICKAVTERLGGKIWVESPPEGGSIFRFSVPKRTEAEERETS